ncbi:MAG TPA: hypothetical protein PKI00_02015 [Candidatus Pacearchaeota archaeon]|nr:hypothetical protein [Candidatus Pacearchaeota archaeon]
MEFLPLKILDFIEELAEKYNLDKEIENDPVVKEALSDANSIGEKQFIKIIYGGNFPSLTLKNIIKDYINKNLSSGQIETTIKEYLFLETDIAMQISQDIIKNNSINELLINPEMDIDTNIENNTDTENTRNNKPSIEKTSISKKGLSQELE